MTTAVTQVYAVHLGRLHALSCRCGRQRHDGCVELRCPGTRGGTGLFLWCVDVPVAVSAHTLAIAGRQRVHRSACLVYDDIMQLDDSKKHFDLFPLKVQYKWVRSHALQPHELTVDGNCSLGRRIMLCNLRSGRKISVSDEGIW